ncbi:hypothetical protein PR202_ga14932 [Eleusine coracana subsp. coracana]|uniref:ZF-HD dimerization-type domain-containing protein n=1 Tax=Eleusine coracana subsp. coracana TaxID=191504 RepID=A0AAV5CIV8_ELECO|nr:hypothetical protein PR202_ga14932 [Eleusine coracana subsp. coracana]
MAIPPRAVPAPLLLRPEPLLLLLGPAPPPLFLRPMPPPLLLRSRPPPLVLRSRRLPSSSIQHYSCSISGHGRLRSSSGRAPAPPNDALPLLLQTTKQRSHLTERRSHFGASMTELLLPGFICDTRLRAHVIAIVIVPFLLRDGNRASVMIDVAGGNSHSHPHSRVEIYTRARTRRVSADFMTAAWRSLMRVTAAAGMYLECMTNHAASVGCHVVDRCGEFMPTPAASLRCAACGTNHSFHRRLETAEGPLTLPTYHALLLPQSTVVKAVLPHLQMRCEGQMGEEKEMELGAFMNEPPRTNQGGSLSYVLLQKEFRDICHAKVYGLPIKVPFVGSLIEFVSVKAYRRIDFPKFSLLPAPEDSHQDLEWKRFISYLWLNRKAAIVTFGSSTFHILPSQPDEHTNFPHAVLMYEHEQNDPGRCKKLGTSVKRVNSPVTEVSKRSYKSEFKHGSRNQKAYFNEETCESGPSKEMKCSHKVTAPRENFIHVDPSYLRTLGDTHAGWIFGALAELIDNSRDAGSSRLDISIGSMFLKKEDTSVPVISLIDDGHGMTYADMMRMVSLDYSLQSYLEVMFLNPRMKICVQGTLNKGGEHYKAMMNGFSATVPQMEGFEYRLQFCHMPPFLGKCEIPEQQLGPDVIVVCEKRTGRDDKGKKSSNGIPSMHQDNTAGP